MTQGTLIPNISEVALVCVYPKDGAIQMVLRACRPSLACPFCGTVSRRVHSRYLRKLGDLPWEKLPVLILLQTRKFFCDGNGSRLCICPQSASTRTTFSILGPISFTNFEHLFTATHLLDSA
jgi:hypothetical protein